MRSIARRIDAKQVDWATPVELPALPTGSPGAETRGSAALGQVPGKEPGPLVHLELRDAGVTAHIGAQRLLPRAERVEEVQGGLSVVGFVVPLQQDLKRNGDLPGFVEHASGQEASREEAGSPNTRLDHRPPDPDGDHS